MSDRVREAELVARAASGDGDAFAELVGPYETKVFNLAYRMCGNREDAFDLAQEAFLKTFRALGRFKGESSFSTWLYRVVANTCLDQLRRQKRSLTVASIDDPVATASGTLKREPSDTTYEPEGLAMRAETEAEIKAAVDRLSPDHRLAILLRDYEDLPYEEIAKAMACSLGTVKSRISRARSSLRAHLAAKELLPRAGVYSADQAAVGGAPPVSSAELGRSGGRAAGSGNPPARGVTPDGSASL